jgi:UDP-2,4-diacetamido-2,4,6-trideoxy-beta-L-altropyranose hydrolase
VVHKRIFIRADANAGIGMGHVMRTLALARMLNDQFDIVYAIQAPSPKVHDAISQYCEDIIVLPLEASAAMDADNFSAYVSPGDIVVLDGYEFGTAYQQKIKEKGCLLVCIDDLQQSHFVADVIINQAIVKEAAYSKEVYTRIFTGNNYFLLNKPFLEAAQVNRSVPFNGRVVISMGGGDPNNLTLFMMKACEKLSFIHHIDVIAGAANPNLEQIKDHIDCSGKDYTFHYSLDTENMAKVMTSCDTIICPASTTAIEACAVKMGIITGISFDNQADLHQSLVDNNCVISIGDLNRATVADIENAFTILNEKDNMKKLQASQCAFVDGRSGERIKNIFRTLADA